MVSEYRRRLLGMIASQEVMRETVADFTLTLDGGGGNVVSPIRLLRLESDGIINWGDGVEEIVPANSQDYEPMSHTYNDGGIYNVTVMLGVNDTFEVGQNWDREYLTSINFLNLSGVIDCSNMFEGCYNLVSIEDLRGISGVDYMNNMFMDCASLVSIPPLNMEGVTDTSFMFYGCTSLTTLPKPPNTLVNMSYMFAMCDNIVGSMDVDDIWDLRNVRNIEGIFSECNSLTTIPTLVNTNNIIIANQAFDNCSSLTTIPGFTDTSSIVEVRNMFNGCTSLTTIPGFSDASNLIDLYGTFDECSSLTTLGSLNGNKAYLSLESSPLLTKESLLNVINGLGVVSGETLQLHPDSLASLTPEDIKIATDKGWIIS